jgi:hypothetical protein
MRWLNFHLIVCIAITVFVAGCKNDEPTQPAHEGFAGIMTTDTGCTVIEGDTTDFLPRPITTAGFPHTPLNYSLIKACPNPVVGDSIYIEFQLPVADSVLLVAFATTNAAPVATIHNSNGPLPAGVYRVLWGFGGPRGIYRVRMTTGSGFSAYGDVEFQ